MGRAVALHGHGFLPLALPAVVPLTSDDFYSGFGFRSTQDDGLLYYHTSPVSSPGAHSCSHLLWGLAGREWLGGV